MTDAPLLVVYSRQGCHLCEILLEELLAMTRGRAAVEVRDVDTRDDWRRRYGTRVPVVEHQGRPVCELRLDPAAVRAALPGA